jgi:heat shock protein HslJ
MTKSVQEQMSSFTRLKLNDVLNYLYPTITKEELHMVKINHAISISTLFILCLVMIACSSQNAPEINSKWVLESLSVNGEQVELITPQPVTLEISEKGLVGGSAGCNSYGGDLKFKAQGKLEVGNLFQTEMWCDSGMEVESAFLNSLSASTQFEMTAKKLTLSTSDGMTTLIFTLAE